MEEIKKILETLKNQMDEVWEEYNTRLETTLASLKASLISLPKPPAIPFDLDQAASLLSKISRPAAAAPAGVEGDPVRSLKESLHRIDSGKTQVEILDMFLEEASKQAGRVALFIYKGEQVMGWKGMGFTRLGSDDARIKSIALPLSEGNPLHTVFQSKHSHLYQPLVEDMICKGFEGPRPDRIFLVPMIIRDKVSAALYADEIKGTTPLYPDALEILTWAASLAVNLLGQRQLVPCPTLTPGAVRIEGTRPAPPSPAAAPSPSAPPTSVPVSERTQKIDLAAMQELEALRRETLKRPVAHAEPKPAPEPPRIEPPPPKAERMPAAPKPPSFEMEYAPQPAMEATAVSAPDVYAVPEAPPATEWAHTEPEPGSAPPPPPAPSRSTFASGTPSMPPRPATTTFIPPPTPFAAVPPPPKPAAETAPMPKLEEELPKKSAEVKPPPGFRKDRPGFGFESFQPQPGMSVEESRRHDEARRFARLLVSEIKLYNEPKVEEGRKNRTIYSLLKEDVDRSRQIYEERIAADIRSKSDYFRQALVSILANGDASALGSDS